MMLSKPVTIGVTDEKEAIEASAVASEIASAAGFDHIASAQVTLAVREIAGNAVKFAGKGIVTMRLSGNKKTLVITTCDEGPGIENAKKAMEEGYSSVTGSLGMGLIGAKRAMDDLVIKLAPRHGTTVTMKKYLPIPEEEIEYGVISVSDEQHHVNGDAYVIKEYEGDKVLLAVIDGRGEGIDAHNAANAAALTLDKYCRLEPSALIAQCDKALRRRSKSNPLEMGVSVGLLQLKQRSLQYAGVGDTGIHIFNGGRKFRCWSEGGTVGHIKLPTLKRQGHRWDREIVVILCSDGINPRFAAEDLPLDRKAQAIAEFIYKNHACEYGDATVLVVKRNK